MSRFAGGKSEISQSSRIIFCFGIAEFSFFEVKGLLSPEINRRTVDFPLPLGPTIQVSVDFSHSKETLIFIFSNS